MASVESGELIKPVVFEKNTPVAQGAGKKDVWAAVITTRGRLERLRGSRTLSDSREVYDNSWELWVRYETALETNLAFGLRVLIEGRYYTIAGYEKIAEKRFWFRFTLNEQR